MTHDIIISGLGRAGIRAFYETISKFENEPNRPSSIKIALVHDQNVFGGPAYSHASSLAPMPFHQSVYTIESQPKFLNWLQQNTGRVLAFFKAHGRPQAEQWVEKYGNDFQNGHYGETRFPRAGYGLYLHDMLSESLKRAEKLGIEVDMFCGKLAPPVRASRKSYHCAAVGADLRPVQLGVELKNNFEFPVAHETHAPSVPALKGRQVALFPGAMPTPLHKNACHHPHYFQNVYDPSKNIAHLKASVLAEYAKLKTPVNVILGGAGPSAMDVVLDFAHDPELKDKFQFHVIASNPKPRPVALTSGMKVAYQPKLLAISDKKFTDADDIIALLNAEIRAGKKLGYTRSEVVRVAFPKFMALLNILPDDKRYQFLENKFPEMYFKELAFDSAEATRAWGTLVSTGVIKKYNAHIVHDTVVGHDGGFQLTCKMRTKKAGVSGALRTLHGQIFVNCMGNTGQPLLNSNQLDPRQNPLVALVNKGLAQLNRLTTGVNVDQHHQLIGADGRTIKNVYLAGILNYNSKSPNGMPFILAGSGPSVDASAAMIAKSMVEKCIHTSKRLGHKIAWPLIKRIIIKA